MGLTGRQWLILAAIAAFAVSGYFSSAYGKSEGFGSGIYDPGQLKPTDSGTTVKIGDQAPDFILPSISGDKVALSAYREKKNVVVSFVPAAWTPVCSQQWPGYNIAKEIFEKNDA